MINNPYINSIYAIYMLISSLITTVLYVVAMFIIIYKSNKEMGLFRLLLCFQISWSFAFELAISWFQFVPLFPLYVRTAPHFCNKKSIFWQKSIISDHFGTILTTLLALHFSNVSYELLGLYISSTGVTSRSSAQGRPLPMGQSRGFYDPKNWSDLGVIKNRGSL